MATDVTQENKLTVKRLYYELLNRRDYSLINDLFAPNALIVANGLRWNNRIWLNTLFDQFYSLVPEPHFEPMVILAEGDMVCASWKMVATPKSSTNAQTYNGICQIRLKTNKIIQLNHRSDLYRIFRPETQNEKNPILEKPSLLPAE